MTLTIAVLVLGAISIPHVLALERVSPALAATIWMAALALRALTAIFSAIFVVLYLPTTQLFTLVTRWCWHAVLPFVATHLPLSGHTFGDVATIAPAFVLAASTMSVLFGLWRAARRVRALLAGGVVGSGPRESLVLADGEVLVAAAGLRRPRVLVSAGALVTFDDDELAASLEHEHGHIAHRHRYVLVLSELCRALARFLPGTRSAARELVFHLERDADDYAVAARQDPTALASAICKAAQGSALAAPALALRGGVVSRRVSLLLQSEGAPVQARQLPLQLLACVMVMMAFAALAAVPAAAQAGLDQASQVSTIEHCLS